MSGRKRDELLLRLGREFQVHDEAMCGQLTRISASLINGGASASRSCGEAVIAAAELQAKSNEGLAVKAMILAAVIRTVGLKPSI